MVKGNVVVGRRRGRHSGRQCCPTTTTTTTSTTVSVVIRCVGHDSCCQALPLDVLQNEDKDGQPEEKVADDDEGEDVLREKGAEDGSTWPGVHRYTAISAAVVPETELALAPALQADAILLQADVRLLGAGSLFDALPAEGVITTGRGAGAPALVVVAGEALISGTVAGGVARLHVVLVIEQVWQLVVPRAIGVMLGWVRRRWRWWWWWTMRRCLRVMLMFIVLVILSVHSRISRCYQVEKAKVDAEFEEGERLSP